MLNKSTKWYVWIDLKKFMTLYHMIGFSNKFGIHNKIGEAYELLVRILCTILPMTSLWAKYQGDSLSLLLFIVCLVPISKIFEDAQKGYCLCQNTVSINHLVYINDVQLYVTQNINPGFRR